MFKYYVDKVLNFFGRFGKFGLAVLAFILIKIIAFILLGVLELVPISSSKEVMDISYVDTRTYDYEE